jgi:DNA topoisomerase-1
MGDRFTAKDFRTWAGTLLCASELARIIALDDGTTSPKKKVRLALDETAKVLGNTPAVCRSSYVCPSVIEAFEKGKVISTYFERTDELAAYRGAALHPVERALIRFLKSEGRR